CAGGETIGGMFSKEPDMPGPCWLYYFNIGDIDATIDRVEARGGELVHGPVEVPGGSWIAQCVDPQGAWFALQGNRRPAALGGCAGICRAGNEACSRTPGRRSVVLVTPADDIGWRMNMDVSDRSDAGVERGGRRLAVLALCIYAAALVTGAIVMSFEMLGSRY